MIKSREQFRSILEYTEYTEMTKAGKTEDMDKQILELMSAVNASFQQALSSSHVLFANYPMVKNFHSNLKRNMSTPGTYSKILHATNGRLPLLK